METIKLSNVVSLGQGVTPEEGMPIRDKILNSIQSGNQITIDFDGMTLITTAFLNVMIGTLYKDYTSDQLKSLLHFINLTDGIAVRIKRVADNAKLFYSNPEAFNRNVDSAIYGNG